MRETAFAFARNAVRTARSDEVPPLSLNQWWGSTKQCLNPVNGIVEIVLGESYRAKKRCFSMLMHIFERVAKMHLPFRPHSLGLL